MDYSLLTPEQQADWRKHSLDFLKNYPEYWRKPGDTSGASYKCGSCAPTPHWAALEIERLDAEVARLRSSVELAIKALQSMIEDRAYTTSGGDVESSPICHGCDTINGHRPWCGIGNALSALAQAQGGTK